MGFREQNSDAIAFKRVLGKSHTQETFSPNEEGYNTNVQVSLSSMFYSEIEPLPVTNSGLTALYSTNGIIERVKFPVEIIPDTYIGTNRSQGYKLKLPSDYNTFGYLFPTYSAGTYLHSSIGRLQIVPANFGELKSDGSTEYDPILYQTNGSTIIQKNDSINWFLDTYSGILFVQDPPAGYDTGTTRPGFVEAYLYVAKYASEVLSGVTAGNNVGYGSPVFINRTDTTLNFKTIAVGTNLGISATTNMLFLHFSGVTGASNGLTRQGKIFKLGGNLTGATTIGLGSNNIILTASTGTIRYGSDLSSNYNIRSLPDVGYVSGLTATKLDVSAFNGYSGTTAPATYVGKTLFNGYTGTTENRLDQIETNYITGATNGLTKIGKKVKLGGSLTGETYISGASTHSLFLGTNTSKLGYIALDAEYIDIMSTSDINLKGTEFNYNHVLNPYPFFTINTSGSLTYQSAANGSNRTNLEVSNTRGRFMRSSTDNSASYVAAENKMLIIGADNGTSTAGAYFSIDVFGATAKAVVGKNGSASFAGLEYFANYSSGFTSRSLVDKGYVTGLTSNGVTTALFNGYTGATRTLFNGYTGATENRLDQIEANYVTGSTNGLTKVGNKILLGGTLTEAGYTTITGNGTNYFKIDMPFTTVNTIAEFAPGGIYVETLATAGTYASIQTAGSGDLSLRSGGIGYVNGIDVNATGILVNSSLAGFGGIKYFSNYSSNFTSRSLVDAGFVTGITSTLLSSSSAITGATNGLILTSNGKKVQLGGALTGNTTIGGASTHRLTLGTSGSKLDRFESNSSNQIWLFADLDTQIATSNGDVKISADGNGALVQLYNESATGQVQLRSNNEINVQFDNLTPAGIRYAADYSGGFNARSLVDAGFVTGITSTFLFNPNIVTGATNGLTKNGKRITLGGTLTGDTLLSGDNGSRTLSFGDIGAVPTSKFNMIEMWSDSFEWYGGLSDYPQLYLNSGVGFEFYSAPTGSNRAYARFGTANTEIKYTRANGTSVSSVLANNSGTDTKLFLSSYKTGAVGSFTIDGGSATGDMTISSTYVGFKGLIYASNYSTNFTSRSLVDAGFVTGITSTLALSSNSITGATNGLTVSGKKVKLGGVVTGATTVGLGANILTFTGSTGHLKYGSDLSSNFNARSIPDVNYVSGLTLTKINEFSVFNTVLTSYTANTTSNFIGCSGVTNIYLPTSPKIGQHIIVTDIKGVAYTTPITIHGNGKFIENDTDILIDSEYGSITLVYNGIMWSIVAYAV